MSNDRFWWFPLIGILFVALLIVSFAVGGEPPDVDEPVEELVAHYVDNDDSVMFGAALQTLAAALFVFFGAYLYRFLRDTEGATGAGALVVFGGVLIFATGIAIDAMISFALAEEADEIDPTAVQALVAIWHNDFFPFALGTFVFLWGFGVSVARHGALPKWLGWVAIILGVVAITPIGFAAFIGTGVLVLIISVLLTMRARSATGATTPA